MLLDLLEAEEALYCSLRDLLREERERMLALEADALGGIVERKQSLAEEGRLAEEARRVLVARMARSLGLGSDEVPLAELCAALDPQSAARLAEARSRLVAIVTAVRELAAANRALGGERLAFVRTTLQLLGRLAPQADVERASSPGALLRTSA